MRREPSLEHGTVDVPRLRPEHLELAGFGHELHVLVEECQLTEVEAEADPALGLVLRAAGPCDPGDRDGDVDRGAGQLSARVLANRIWHHLLGRGLVRTVDNFGRTGEQPTHPELLDHLARHPSQLYQAAGEGIGLFILLAIYSRAPRPVAAISGLFLVGYGCFRFMAEFFREPDAHIAYLAGDWLTMGMVLSLPMVLAGAVIMILAYRFKVTQ